MESISFALKPAAARSRPRSISLPTLRSSSKAQKAEREQLVKKLKSLEAAPLKIEDICSSLSSLVELYTSIDELINTPETLQLSYNKRHEWIDTWLEESVVFLDVCSSTREAVLTLTASVCEVQSALRRRNSSSKSCHGSGGELSSRGGGLESDHLSANYLRSAKQTKKDIKKSLSTLKRMESKFSTTTAPPAQAAPATNNNDSHRHSLVDVISALREASKATVSVLESILSCLFEPRVSFHANGAPRKWSVLSKLMLSNSNVDPSYCKYTTDQPDEKLDASIGSCLALLQRLSRRDSSGEEGNAHRLYAEMMTRCLCERLKALEKGMEGIDKKMECLFRCLIQTRVSFLNILSN